MQCPCDVMYIYFNIVENQIVGGTMALFLCIVTAYGGDEKTKLVDQTYDRIGYVPVLIKDITANEINIWNDSGDFLLLNTDKNPCTNKGPYEFEISPDIYMLDLSKNYGHVGSCFESP
uniref:Uncharacterized protein n=1 Tax=Romanomermis culicivorax TaxID=13658 RepID=A0A915HS71_ROMCU